MRKINFVLSFIFVIMIFGLGCGNNNSYYFRLKINSLTLEVGESIDVSALEYNTNLPKFEHMYIQANEEKINIKNLVLSAKQAGETEIFINAVYKGKTYSCKLYVIINNKAEFSEVDVLSFSLKKVDNYNEEVNIYIIDIFKNKNEYYNFSFDFITIDNDKLIYFDKSGCCIEIWYLKDENFSIKVIDNNFVNNILIINIE